jgi:hypothetical protein
MCSEPGPVSPEQHHLFEKNNRYLISINDADFMITSYKINDPKYFYFPHFIMWFYHHVKITKIYKSFDYFTEYKNFNLDYIKNKKFCIFLHHNSTPPKRKEIFYKLSNYKTIDSNLFNKNIDITPYYNAPGGGSYNKINFIKNYKFTFSMNNYFYKDGNVYTIPGTIDEKMIEPYFANTIPLFYGNDEISDIFNKDSFINWHDFNDDEKFIEKIIEIDNNDKLYLDMINQPTFLDLNCLRLDLLSDTLKKLIG